MDGVGDWMGNAAGGCGPGPAVERVRARAKRPHGRGPAQNTQFKAPFTVLTVYCSGSKLEMTRLYSYSAESFRKRATRRSQRKVNRSSETRRLARSVPVWTG